MFYLIFRLSTLGKTCSSVLFPLLSLFWGGRSEHVENGSAYLTGDQLLPTILHLSLRPDDHYRICAIESHETSVSKG